MQLVIHAGKILDLEIGLTRFVRLLRELVAQLTADHQADDIVHLQLCGRLRCDMLAVAHDGDFIGDALDLRHFMRNVDDAETAVAEHVDDAEQMLHLFLRQRRRRLIKYNNFRVIGNRLRNFHHLTLRNRHCAHDPVRIDINAELFEDFNGIVVHFLFVDHETGCFRVPAQPEVVHDRALERLIELLVHHSDAVVQRLLAAGKVDFPAFEIDMAAVLVVNAEQAFHQCRLAGAVFAHQRVNRSGLDLQADLIERPDAGEVLCNVFHLKQYGLLHPNSPP